MSCNCEAMLVLRSVELSGLLIAGAVERDGGLEISDHCFGRSSLARALDALCT